MPLNVLLAGESWTTTATHIKGWDQFPTVTHHRGADAFIERVADAETRFTWMQNHEAGETFPDTVEALSAYDVVILSDIGANTLLLPSGVWLHSRRAPNRLKAIRDYVRGGGGLIMVGGYYSFQGINGGARYRGTPVEEALPVSIHPYDDRLELPEGAHPEVAPGAEGHPALGGVSGGAPYLLGMNEVVAKPCAATLLRLPEAEGGHPLLVVGEFGGGRSAAWTTDIGPHWLPSDFLAWEPFGVMWRKLLRWTAGG